MSVEHVPIRPVWPNGAACFAHTPGSDGRWHSFGDHAKAVGDLAAEFAEPFGASSLARFLGYTHDAGKLVIPVQEALRARAIDHLPRLGVPHKAEGAALAWLLFQREQTLGYVAHLVNYGHHSGIPEFDTETKGSLKEMRRAPQCLDPLIERLDEQLGVDIRAVANSVELPLFLNEPDRKQRRLKMDVYARMVHSALVDADYLDTAAHFSGQIAPARHVVRGMSALRDCFMSWYQHRFGSAEVSDINDLRRAVFQSCVNSALDPKPAAEKRIYRLAVQTGGGKTLAAAAFALHHAAAFGKRRIIVAVPFTSITTQNAGEYRKAFEALGDDVVLEHHSNLTEAEDEKPRSATARPPSSQHRSYLPEADDENPWRRLSAENWDAEFIVTTTVQLFESLFSGKPAAARKLHRIANSVIVIDEVQALPLLLVPAILAMLSELVSNYAVTVVLASATQPTFWNLKVWRELAAPHDIVPRHEVPKVTRRVSYELRQSAQSWDEIAEEIAEIPCALTIVNTTSDARTLHSAVAERVPDATVLHLSTRMCNQHRRDVIARIRYLLDSGSPVQLISTQLIEAGVNVDFPVVYRAMAPAESIVQSAGRCNREGHLGIHGGRVVIFESPEQKTPNGLYASATKRTRDLLAGPEGVRWLGEPAMMDRYYRDLLAARVEDSDAASGVEKARVALNFPKVAELFRMIEDTTASVVVTQYGDSAVRQEVESTLQWISADSTRIIGPEVRRRLQRFTATVPLAYRDCHVIKLAPGISQWVGDYDDYCGVAIPASASIW